MQLDRTRIAIRERSLLDILDMSLKVIGAYPGPWLLGTLTLVVPLMLFNWWLIGWMPGFGEDAAQTFRYIATMSMLVFIEAPLGSMLVTLYLGQAMFLDQPNPREIARTLWRSSLAVFWCQLVVRGILLAWILLWAVPRTSTYSGWEGWLIVLTLYVAAVRAFRPFINEIVLLERNPLRSQGDYQITVGRRSSSLHNPNASDLLARWISTAVIGTLLIVSVLFTIWFVWGMLLFNWRWGPWMIHVFIPGSMWVIAGYISVVRFMCYLDLRIRREGWEVELIIRAAATKLLGQAA